MEVNIARPMFFGVPSHPNNVFFQFMRNLGPGTLRMGGSSQDQHCWDMNLAPNPAGCYEPVSADDMQSYYYASAQTGWPVLLGLNLAQNSGTWAAREIDEGIAAYSTPAQRLGVEIGNEPDGYYVNLLANGKTIRPATYSMSDYIGEFQGYLNAFSADPFASTVPVAGPGFTGRWHLPELTQFLDAVGNRIGIATMHWYPTNRCKVPVATSQILDPLILHEYGRVVGEWAQIAQKHNLGLQLTETNSVACSGQPGVSDTFAQSIWAVDWMLFSPKVPLRRINFHTGTTSANKLNANSYYNLIQSSGPATPGGPFSNQAEPLYYAVHMFDAVGPGSSYLPVTLQTPANITAYALTRCGTCPINVFVVNKDLAASSPVSIGFQAPMGQASLLTLSAPSLGSTAGDIQYGGQQFDNATGLLKAPLRTTAIAADASGNYNFQLQNSSAAMMTILRPGDRPAAFTSSGLVDAASSRPAIAPGSLVSLYGSSLTGTNEEATGFAVPTRLAGEQITINQVPVAQLYAAPGQINFQVPFELAAGPASLVHSSGAIIGNPVSFTLAPYAPAIFALPQVGAAQGAVLIAGTESVAAPPGTITGARPVHAGEFISIYCTGLGAVSNPPAAGVLASASPLSRTTANPTVTIGGVSAPVDYSGLAPYFAGLDQVNVAVPPGAPKGSAVPVVISIGGVTSNSVTIAID